MNKKELVKNAAGSAGMSEKDTAKALDAILESVTQALEQGEPVQLVGFGTFTVKQRPERQGMNPATGAKMTFPAKKVAGFKAGKALQERVK